MRFKNFSPTSLMTLALLVLPFGSVVATDEMEVGVTAASVIDAKGKPPISPARDLETGVDVFFSEKISTDENGRAQLLFRDGTSLTVGASSEMTIDEYIYDPATGTGDMVVSISKGVFRVVGGKISKNKPIVFNSPTATVAVRGCIFVAREGDNGFTGSFVYGDFAEVTPKNGGPAIRTSLPGYSVKVDLNQKATKEKTDQAALTRDLAALEKSAEQPEPAAADEPSAASDQQAGGAQPEDPGQEPAPAEGDQANTAPQPEPGEKSAEEGSAPEPGLARTEPEPNQPPAEESGLVGIEGDPDRPLPGNNQPPPEPGAEPLGPAPLPPAESGEFGTPPVPEAGLADNIPATDLPPLPTGSEGEITIAPGTARLPPLPAGSEGAVYVAPDTLPATGLPPLPGASEGGIVIAPGTSPTPGLPPAPLKLEITSLTLDLSKDVAAYVPPIGSPMGGTPVHAHSEPTVELTELTKAVDDTTKTRGVLTEDGTSVTAPTGGWTHSTAYLFTGDTEAEKPTYYDPETTDKEKICDPAVEYCPYLVEDPSDPSKIIKSDPSKIIKYESTTTSCDATTECTGSTTPKATSPSTTTESPYTETRTYSITTESPYTESPYTETRTYSMVAERTFTLSCDEGICSSAPAKTLTTESATDEPKPLVATGIFDTGTDFAMTSSIGQENSPMRLVGDQIPLCTDCRFLKWHRKTTLITDSGHSISEIQHWISGAAATASELSAAAGKTARYSGGLVGAVAGGGVLHEQTGSFDAHVQFGVSAYQVQNFNAEFDGSRYSGASGLTPNNTVFDVTGSSGARTLQAGGYFFGSTTRGNAPPDIGGHFKVTGHDYHAAGVFAGSQR